jgi:hypothetical protein
MPDQGNEQEYLLQETNQLHKVLTLDSKLRHVILHHGDRL